jgi:lysophospholipase L1-like esterase
VARPNLRTRFFRTNALGFRGPETPVTKPPGRFRIVVLGGSAAWGLGCTADDRTVPGRLEAALRSRYPGRDVEVINGAQTGFVSGQELIYYHRTVAQLAPDLVLLLDGYNDVEADFANPEPGLPQNAAHLRTRYQDFLSSGRLGQDLARFLRGSRFLDVASRWIGGGGAKGPWVPVVEPAATAKAYVRNVTALARLAAPTPVHVALQPVPAVIRKPLSPEEARILAEKEQAIQGYAERVRTAYREMEDGVRRAGLPLIRLDDALGTEPRLLFVDECHFGDEAARLIGAAIAEEWIRRGVLGP